MEFRLVLFRSRFSSHHRTFGHQIAKRYLRSWRKKRREFDQELTNVLSSDGPSTTSKPFQPPKIANRAVKRPRPEESKTGVPAKRADKSNTAITRTKPNRKSDVEGKSRST